MVLLCCNRPIPLSKDWPSRCWLLGAGGRFGSFEIGSLRGLLVVGGHGVRTDWLPLMVLGVKSWGSPKRNWSVRVCDGKMLNGGFDDWPRVFFGRAKLDGGCKMSWPYIMMKPLMVIAIQVLEICGANRYISQVLSLILDTCRWVDWFFDFAYCQCD